MTYNAIINIIIWILVFLVIRKVIQTFRDVQAQLPREDGTERSDGSDLPEQWEQYPEYEWEHELSQNADFEWLEEITPPKPESRKITLKPREFAIPLASQPAPAVKPEPKQQTPTTMP
ncbi:MAG: hypothetical protein FWD21_02330, partial [Peptococcaceae bacterium]|nr:hypothetical protein [Peptococcaceae bacterium]